MSADNGKLRRSISVHMAESMRVATAEYNDLLYAKRIVRAVNRIMVKGRKPVYLDLPGQKIRVKTVASCTNQSCIIVTDHEGFTHKVLPNNFINKRGEQVCAKRP